MAALKDVLQIEKGVTAVVGGGGKTSTILQVAKELGDIGAKVIVTTTTRMFALEKDEVGQVVLEQNIEAVSEAFEKHQIIGVGSDIIGGKMIGVNELWIEKLAQIADYVLVEADGSRRLPIKAPGAHEPVIPQCSKKVVSVLGWSGVRQVIGKICFRPERVCAIIEKDESAILEPMDIIKLVLADEGLQKGVGKRKWCILINQVDTLEDEQLVKEVADRIKEKTVAHVVVAALKQHKWMQG